MGEHKALRGERLALRSWRVRYNCAQSEHGLTQSQVQSSFDISVLGDHPAWRSDKLYARRWLMKYSCHELGIVEDQEQPRYHAVQEQMSTLYHNLHNGL